MLKIAYVFIFLLSLVLPFKMWLWHQAILKNKYQSKLYKWLNKKGLAELLE